MTAGFLAGIALAALPCAPELWRPTGPWEISASISEGYTHYRASELNEVLVLMESLTREAAGLNPYTVTGFDGHPATQASLAFRKGPWRLGLEMEFWTQTFRQEDVPFDLSDNTRENRITCADLAAKPVENLAGCIQAKEEFFFLPMTLQLSWMPQWTTWLRGGLGYGVGVLGGSASMELSTQYYGGGAARPDRISFDIVPDPKVNAVHKVFAALEWTPLRFASLEARGGIRLSEAGGFTLREPSGSSQVFDAAFQAPGEGDQLWIRWPESAPDRRAIWIGSRQAAMANASRYGHQLVHGDFSGWFAALALNFRWGPT
ncbi:MAG TPA: hypothetical protein PKO15_13910 [Fibrobacteria bacterium]|nr:hypothetical protein [Fibrobacteria bacterium]